MFKYQLTFIEPVGKGAVDNGKKPFKVFGSESEARAILGLHTVVEKPSKQRKSNVVELTKVLYQGDNPVAAKFVTRVFTSDKSLQELKKPKVVAKAKTKE